MINLDFFLLFQREKSRAALCSTYKLSKKMSASKPDKCAIDF